MRTFARFLSLVFAAIVLPGSLHAAVITSDPNLPVLYPTGVYTNTRDVHPAYNAPGVAILIQNEQYRAAGPVTRTPSGPDERESSSFGILGNISFNGSLFVSAYAGTAEMLTLGKVGNTTGTFSAEILSLTLAGSGFIVRESPTLASTGQTSITGLGGGLYQIDSFFDVFTEVSIDGGQTWIPDSNGAAHITLGPVPEPGTAGLIGIGILSCAGLYWQRRRR